MAITINETYRSTDLAAGRLQELLGMEERTARAVLTIAADLGTFTWGNLQVIGDDDAQEFVIRSL